MPHFSGGDISVIFEEDEDLEKREEAWHEYQKSGGYLRRQEFDDMQEVEMSTKYFISLHKLSADNEHELVDAQWSVLNKRAILAAFIHLQDGPDLQIGFENMNPDGPSLANMAAKSIKKIVRQGDLCLPKMPNEEFFSALEYRNYLPIASKYCIDLLECETWVITDSV